MGMDPQNQHATRPFLIFDTVTGAFLKFDMLHGNLNDMHQC